MVVALEKFDYIYTILRNTQPVLSLAHVIFLAEAQGRGFCPCVLAKNQGAFQA